ncbi:MAG: hypothetical protein IID54_04500, partial [Proteobacteria bacterium]|nr:hypothetical protein [Pseudomonadota bacterium]
AAVMRALAESKTRKFTPMRKPEKYSEHTNSMGFELEIMHDEANRDFVARVSPSTPPFLEQYIPGQQPANMQFGITEEYRDTDKQKLLERCKTRMEELGQGTLIITKL